MTRLGFLDSARAATALAPRLWASPSELSEESTLTDIKRVAGRNQTIDLNGGPSILASARLIAGRLPSLRIVINYLPFRDWDGDPAAMRAALAEVAARSGGGPAGASKSSHRESSNELPLCE